MSSASSYGARAAARVREHETLLLTLATMLAALADPRPGARLYASLSRAAIVTLFVLTGLNLEVRELGAACVATHVHAATQAFSLGLTPLLFWAGCYRWGWAGAVLGETFAAGTMAALCMPTTTNTGVMFTQQADGDVSVAAINAALGNVLGAFVAPLVASAALGGAVAQQPYGPLLLDLVEQIVAPLLAGVGAMAALGRALGRERARAARPIVARGARLALLCILYLVFCKAFARGGEGASPGALARLAAVVAAVHLALVALAWRLGARLRARRRVAFVLMATQKTESMGIAILGVIFDDDDRLGQLALPVVAYHTLQMVVAACAVPALRARVAREDADAAAAARSRAAMLRDGGGSSSEEDDERPVARREMRGGEGLRDARRALLANEGSEPGVAHREPV